jgi:hypothetical protein
MDALKTVCPVFFRSDGVKVRAVGSGCRLDLYDRSATTLAERRTGKGTLKAGETITAKFIPARNGNPLVFLKTVTAADGKAFQVSSGNLND